MKLNTIADNPGARAERMRVGRGIGSGKGKTSGRGVKGQKARSGVAIKGFEGGQMPIHRRLPKRGFHNLFRIEYLPVNLWRIQAAIDSGRLAIAEMITTDQLKEAGIVGARFGMPIRLLATGVLTTAINIQVDAASKAAVAVVEAAGGKVILIPQPGERETDKPRKLGKRTDRRNAAIALASTRL